MTTHAETYEQAIEFLYGRINYERAQSESYSASDFRLERMRRLLELIGNPHEDLPAVHVAGTKGKGSTSSMIAAVLVAAGYRVGLFTSPHLTRFEERMTLNGVAPTPAELVELVNEIRRPVAEMDGPHSRMPPTYFEIATALAWLYFRRRGAEVAVLEVGLGGRLDSTNLCRPEVCVITNVSRDHMHLLGSSVRQIAAEKAGIIKPGVPVISGARHPEALAVIEETCRSLDSPLAVLEREIHLGRVATAANRVNVRTPWGDWQNVPVPLIGEHQALNTALAVATIDQLRQLGWNVSRAALDHGLQGVRWPARIELMRRRPAVVIDAAHNWESIAALLKTLRTQFPSRRRILVFATTRDKDVSGMLRQLLPEFQTLILTQYQDNPRAVPCRELSELVQAISGSPAHVVANPATAWKLAERLAGPDDLVCITGSFFLAAELRDLLLDQPAICVESSDVTTVTPAAGA